MINVDDFIKQNNPNRSVLARFHDDIAKLRAAKMSYQKIQEYLELNGVKTHMNNVRGYCQRHIENKVDNNAISSTDKLSTLAKPKKNVSSTSKSAKSSKTSSAKTSSRNATAKRPAAKKIAKKPAIKKSPNKRTDIKKLEQDKQTSLF
ncbi:hypothetical protein V757_01910 [Pelistega indica]|uniref:Uncharacterized protein n=1 Tax=Pelistega indica TaxID=1414851 RepID=V8G8F7_9BURK|nr:MULTISPECIES: hypothetical protein [Pelistega]ETD72819.1 hypothetical protein V757_01910 [Pelistega indica]